MMIKKLLKKIRPAKEVELSFGTVKVCKNCGCALFGEETQCPDCLAIVEEIRNKRPTKDEYYLDMAEAALKRSTCLKRKYGVVIVNSDEIVATGYNGSPRGEDNCCDLGECKRLELPSNSGDYSKCHSVHAEQNALLSVSRKDMIGATMYITGLERSEIPYGGKTVKTWKKILNCEPCPICARLIANAGIVRVVNRKGEVDIKCLL